MDSPPSTNVWLDLLADALAEHSAAKLHTQLTAGPRCYPAEDDPLALRRAFPGAPRRRQSPSFRRGKHLLARRKDADACIEARPNEARAPDRACHLEHLLWEGLRPIGTARGGRR